MIILTAVFDMIRKKYNEAQHLDYVNKPLSWALYQVWKHVNSINRFDLNVGLDCDL